jgi:hypothetical protein
VKLLQHIDNAYPCSRARGNVPFVPPMRGFVTTRLLGVLINRGQELDWKEVVICQMCKQT